MATTVTKEFRFDSDNAETYAEAEMNVLNRDGNFIRLYLNNDSYEDVYLKQNGKNQLFPTSTAKPYRLDHSMRYRRTVGGTGHFYFYIDGTEIHHTSTTSNSYTTDDKTNITVSAVTNCTSASEFRWYVGIDRTSRGALLLWDKFIFYFYQYACSASAGTGISAASVDVAAPYQGDTVTFTCTLTAGYKFKGWYNGSTLVSSSQTYACSANDLSLTAVGEEIPLGYRPYIKENGSWVRAGQLYKKENGAWIALTEAPTGISSGDKVLRIHCPWTFGKYLQKSDTFGDDDNMLVSSLIPVQTGVALTVQCAYAESSAILWNDYNSDGSYHDYWGSGGQAAIATLDGYNVYQRTLEASKVVVPYIRVQIHKNLLTYCKVWQNGTLIFDGTQYAIKKYIRIPAPSTTSNYAYTGSTITPSWINYNSEYITISGDTSASAVGNYSTTFTIVDPTKYNWIDGTSTAKTICWSITTDDTALRITAIENTTVQINQVGTEITLPTIQYKLNSGSWTNYTYGTAISLSAGQYISWKGSGTTFSLNKNNYGQFVFGSGKVRASGNVCSLINYATLPNYCFNFLFYNCVKLVSASIFPANNISRYCYRSMFEGCTGLTTAPELPAVTLDKYCYYYLFKGCTGLTKAPELPAYNLAETCYLAMFQNCTGLTEAPKLRANNMEVSCYAMMFQGCTGLTVAPELPATNLANNCYYNMFQDCTNLTTVPALPAAELVEYCYYYMFNGCTNLTTVPVLSATTLTENCYTRMFNGCTSLQINDAQTAEATHAWRIPTTGVFENTFTQTSVFTDCAGNRASDIIPGEAGQSYTYYTQNQPIS